MLCPVSSPTNLQEENYAAWKLDTDNYTMEHIASRVHVFFSEKATEANFKSFLMLRICGYSAGRPLPELWEVVLNEGNCSHPRSVQSEQDIGPRWDGEYEALNRIILGLGTRFIEAAVSLGLTNEQAAEAGNMLMQQLNEPLILPAAPIQDAIDLARFMVETTKNFIRFSVIRAKTVGGVVEIAAITKHEGFKWVQRKHFFPLDLNTPY